MDVIIVRKAFARVSVYSIHARAAVNTWVAPAFVYIYNIKVFI